MKVFAVSDVHIDYEENRAWLSALSTKDYQKDILILAGDVTDDHQLLEECFDELAGKFLKVLFVPGNHELWVSRNRALTSIEKFHQILSTANKYNIALEPYHINGLSIVPLLSWYDFSFSTPCKKLMDTWMDFRACVWPNNLSPLGVTQYFLEMNQVHLKITNQTTISFSHFLPRIDLMPHYIPESYRYLYPVLGTVLLEKQIRQLRPDIHVYGHSHVNRQLTLDGTRYINNAFGYPSEGQISKKKLLCLYET